MNIPLKRPPLLQHDSSVVVEALESRIAPAFFSPIDLSLLNSVDGSVISGVAAFDQSGFAVSDAGDVNGDGLGDFIVGANNASPGGVSQAGAAYVVFGTPVGFGPNFDLSTLTGANGFKLNGVAVGDHAGWAVSAAGDVNGDAYDDVIIGAPGDPGSPGAAYVVFGKPVGFPAALNLSSLDGSNGFKLTGGPGGERAGFEASGAGDINGDGFADVIVGAYAANSQTGRAYVVFGKAADWSANFNLSTTNGTNGFQINGEFSGDNFGAEVGAAGDFNGDGIDDFVIGANGVDDGAEQNVGATYVVFGKTTAFPPNFSLATLNGTTGFKAIGVDFNDTSGDSVSTIGDFNGDGFDDIVTGAFRADPNESYSGASYIIFGTSTPISSPLPLASLDGTNGFKISGEGFSDLAGWDVKNAGDLNGDGYSDLAIGAPRSGEIGKTLAGAAYVVFGKASGFGSEFQLSSVNGGNGIKLLGAAAGDYAGVSVSGAGDVNGDGFDDVILGAYQADPQGLTKAGVSYVIYGKQTIDANIGGNGKSASFTGTSGQLVTITVSKGSLSPSNIILKGVAGGGAELLRLNLTDSMFQGAAVTITSSPAGASSGGSHGRGGGNPGPVLIGSGFVNVGFLDASGVDLGKVTVDGDLARILAGDATPSTPAFKSLTVNSLGLLGSRLLLPEDDGPSAIVGGMKTLKVLTDVSDFTLQVDSIDSFSVAGSVDDFTLAATTLGTVKISGSVTDSEFLLSGISAPAKSSAASVLKSATIGGSFIRSQLLAGYDAMGGPAHADVTIGTVTVNGNWVASDLAVGVSAGADGLFGDDNDTLIPGGSPSIIATISKLIIKGDAYGTFESGDQFGILAEQINSASIGKTKLGLNKTAADEFSIGATADFLLREVKA